MKYAIIIIVTIIVTMLLAAGCAVETQTKTVYVTPTPAETTAVAEESWSLTADEQEVYDFIAAKMPEMKRCVGSLDRAVNKASNGDYDGMVTMIGVAVEQLKPINRQWNNLPEVGGNVHELELAFDRWIRAAAAFGWDLADFADGGNVTVNKAVKDRKKCFRYRDQVERLLRELEQ